MSTYGAECEIADAARFKEKWKLRKVPAPVAPRFFSSLEHAGHRGNPSPVLEQDAGNPAFSSLLPPDTVRGQMAGSLPTANIKFAQISYAHAELAKAEAPAGKFDNLLQLMLLKLYLLKQHLLKQYVLRLHLLRLYLLKQHMLKLTLLKLHLLKLT